MEGLKKAYALGRERDIFFGMPAVEYVYNKIEPEAFKRIGNGEFFTKDVKVIAHFVYAGLMGGCERNDQEIDFTYGDVYSEVDKLMFTKQAEYPLFQAIGAAFGESQTVRWALESSKKKEKVKRSVKKLTGAK